MTIYYNQTALSSYAVDSSGNIELSSNSYYDQAFVINLDRYPARWESASSQLTEAGANFKRFSAIDGYKLEITDPEGVTITGQELKDTVVRLNSNIEYSITEPLSQLTFKYKGSISAGELGVYASHIKLWTDALYNNYDIIVIFEDDIKLNDPINFEEQLNNFIGHLPANFDIGFLGYEQVIPSLIINYSNTRNYKSALSHPFLSFL